MTPQETRSPMSGVSAAPFAPGPQEAWDIDADEQSLPILQDLQARYGDTHRVPTVSRAAPGVVIHDPEDIKRVLLTNRNNYAKGVGLERVRVLLGNGLIVVDGDVWARQRRMMQPAFHSRVIRGFAELMHRENLKLVERWGGFADRGEPINLTHDLSDVTLNIVLYSIFGVDLDRIIEREGANPFDLLTRETKRDIPFAIKFRALTKFVKGVIETRRAEDRVEHDFLSMLMQARDRDSGDPMADRALLDEVMTLIVAGHETTAGTLNWTWWLLSQHPQVAAELHAAVDALPDARVFDGQLQPSAPYVEQVVREGMRLYPSVWLLSRRALEDDQVGGFAVPAGTDVFIVPYLLQRNPRLWTDPDAFDPTRFSTEAETSHHPFAFLPFSSGPRHCIGAGFAMAEMATHMTMVAQQFTLDYADSGPPEPEFQINLRTRRDVTMRVTRRAAATR